MAKLEAANSRDGEIGTEHKTNGPSADFENQRKQRRKRINHERGQLWLPQESAFVAMGIRISLDEAQEYGIDLNHSDVEVCGSEVRSVSPDHYFKAFAGVWAKVFQPNSIDLEAAQEVLGSYLQHKKWDWSKLIHPTLEIVEFVLEHLKSTAPGLDGISNMAWKFGGKFMAPYVLGLVDSFCEDEELPTDINDGLMVFIDKLKDETSLSAQPKVVFRHPSETRPLTLKQGDNKHVAATLNFCISPAIVDGAIDTQRGFVSGRQLSQNTVDLDFHGRKHALEYFGKSNLKETDMLRVPTKGIAEMIPLLLLFDYAAAFPSVAHAWLFLVLDAIKLWRGFRTAIKRLYKGNRAFGECNGLLSFMFEILTGVLQGCPLSGTLFVLAIDPLLWMFRIQINSAVVRACADDVGVALRFLKQLRILYDIFEKYAKATNLKLKPGKCIIIPTTCMLDEESLSLLRSFLEQEVPQWAAMKIQGTAKYLGAFIGPRAGTQFWKAAIQKFKSRCVQIKQMGLPIGLATARFNTHAVSVLGFLAQLAPPPLV